MGILSIECNRSLWRSEGRNRMCGCEITWKQGVSPAYSPVCGLRLRTALTRYVSTMRRCLNTYSTINHGDLIGKTPLFWSPPAMVSTAAYGPPPSVPLDGARLYGHGRRRLRPATSKSSGGRAHTVQSTVDFFTAWWRRGGGGSAVVTHSATAAAARWWRCSGGSVAAVAAAAARRRQQLGGGAAAAA
jgi:hypothetical protein